MPITPTLVLTMVRRAVLVILISGLAGVLVAGLLIPLAASLGLVARDSANEFGNLSDEINLDDPLYQRSRVVDAKGRTIATFYDQNRIYVPLDKIAPVMQKAMLAIEDHRFYEHGPIDFQGTFRAFTQNLQAGGIVGGGSTLTQQYVKLLQINREGVDYSQSGATDLTYRRKLEELRLALKVEQELTKDEILERYLNIAYFGTGGGGGVHGIEAAARAYFSTSAAELTLGQAAMLAGLVQQPTRYDPTKNPEIAVARRNTVLDRMAEEGMITEGRATKVQASELGLELRPTPNGCVGSSEPFYCLYVKEEILDKMEWLGETRDDREAALNRAGLTIHTTLDRKNQRAAQKAIDERVFPTDSAVAALASVEPGTGKVRALAQSRPYGIDAGGDEFSGRTYINFAVDYDPDYSESLGAQAGSTYKAFVLAAAIDQGVPLDKTFYSPHTMTIPEREFDMCDGPRRSTQSWTLSNYSTKVSNQRHTVMTGTEQSVNTFYAQLEQLTGLCDPIRIATDLGVTRFNGDQVEMIPSFVLGANTSSPLMMAEAYATFAARGMHCESYAVEKIVDRGGETVYEAEPDCERALDKGVADGVNFVLQSVVENGTGRAMQLSDGRDAAGKTGTTNNTTAVWWIGYIPQLTTAVATWDPKSIEETLSGRSYGGEVIAQACGGCIPGPIWLNTMEALLDKYDSKSFAEPSDEIVRGEEDPIPDVRGRSEGDAREILEDAGFEPYVAGEEQSENIPEGEVITTTPGPYDQHEIGGQVGLILSSGSPPEPEPSDPPDNGNGNGNGGDGDGGDGDGGGDGDNGDEEQTDG